jgi:hypothetical protein
MKLSVGAKVEHPAYGEGAIYSADEQFWKIFFIEEGEIEIGRSYDGLTVLESAEKDGDEELTMESVEEKLRSILQEYVEKPRFIELGNKWEGGVMTLQPADLDLKPKEIPVETFFHKIVMMRDRLRALEQNVNSHKSLSDEEKVNLQQYITRCYGSMTTFNILFAHKEDYFRGESK